MRLNPKSEEIPIRAKLPVLNLCCIFLILGFFMGWKNVPGFIKANLILLSEANIVDALTEDNDLETIRLNITFKNLSKIDSKRHEAIAKERLVRSDSDFVKAEISYNGETNPCKIRLKGDLADHWAGDKFSLRVEMKGDTLVKGMSRFSLQDPVTRNNTAEWLYLETLKKEGCMAVHYDFVNLVINGKKMGIYAIEEHFSKELIESNQRREGVIVRFDDYLLWKKSPDDLASNIEWNSIFRSATALSRNSKRILADEVLNNQKVTAINLLRSIQENSLEPSKIFDAKILGKFLAITRLWQTERSLLYADINFYFNPITCLLEPIGFDGNPAQGVKSLYCYFSWGDIKDNWVNFALSDPKIAAFYVHYLHQFTSEDFLKVLFDTLRDRESKYRNLIRSEMLLKSPSTIWKNYLTVINYNPESIIRSRADLISAELSEQYLVQTYGKKSSKNSNIEILLRNATTQPVEVLGFSSEDQFWSAIDIVDIEKSKGQRYDIFNDSVVLYGQGNGYTQTKFDQVFTLPLKDLNSSLHAQIRFLGSPNSYLKTKVPVDDFNFDAEYLPLNEATHSPLNLPEFILEGNGSLVIPPGRHICQKDLYVPSDKVLYFSPGSILLFEENTTLVSEGPLYFKGTKESPITLTSLRQSWGGLLLANAQGKSFFENVTIEKVSGIGKGPNPQGKISNGWTMTGGVTVFNSDVDFIQCVLRDFQTEDALNIVSSSFILEGCKFSNHYSDAFDGDFVKGSISNCDFSEISGDGIDFSGSFIKVNSSRFSNISDKAISIGESSLAKISGCHIKGVSFGVVSKDHSKTEVFANTKIENATTAAFAAFQKKNLFGPAFLRIEDSLIKNSKKDFMIQQGSTGIINDRPIATKDFKTDQLYQSEK